MKKRILSVLLIAALIISGVSVAIYANETLNPDYTVTVSSAISGGSISVNKKTANAGDVVEVTINPKKGYITKAGSTVYTYSQDGLVTKALVNRVSENAVGKKFYLTMPKKNITVFAEFLKADQTNYSFDIIASSVKSSNESFETGSFNAMSYVSRIYFPSTSRDINTGVINLLKDGESCAVSEIGTLYAKTETLGPTTDLTLGNVGTNGIFKSKAYDSNEPLEDKFVDITNEYIDFGAEFAVESSDADYTVKSYIKFEDGTVVYSKERTDFADNVAARLGLCDTNNTVVDETLTISNKAVNTSFEGFGVVMYPWTTTCMKGEAYSTTLEQSARQEIRLMYAAGIKKVRLIVPSFPPAYYDFDNKVAKTLTNDWYTKVWVDMLNALNTYGISVELNFGWGTELANSMKKGKFESVLGSAYDANLSFDEQVTAYGQLSAELTRYLLSAGCKNIKAATFLSEPGNGWSGSTWDEVINQSPQLNYTKAIEAYDKCARSVQTEFAKNNITGIKFVYGNVSLLYDPTINTIEGETSVYPWWTLDSWDKAWWSTHDVTPGKDWVRETVSAATKSGTSVDRYAYHYYGKFNNEKVSNYTANKTALDDIASEALNGTNLTANDIYMDEVSVKYYGSNETPNDKSKASAFEATQLAEYLSALMNSGYKGAYLWTFSDFASNNMFGLMPNATSAANGNGVPYDRYYAATLITKYLNGCATIYEGSESNGCVTVKGVDKDGNTTVLVVNMNHVNKTVKVNLGEDLGKTLKRHVYNPSVNYRTIEGKLIGFDKQFENVASSFTDTIPAGGVAIYTTK